MLQFPPAGSPSLNRAGRHQFWIWKRCISAR